MLLLWIIVRCSQCNSRLLEYHHHHILWHKWESLLQRDTYWMSTVIAVLRVISKDVSWPEQYDHGIWPWSFILKISIMVFFFSTEILRLSGWTPEQVSFRFFCLFFPLCLSLPDHPFSSDFSMSWLSTAAGQLSILKAWFKTHGKQFSSQPWQALDQTFCGVSQQGLNSSSSVIGNRWILCYGSWSRTINSYHLQEKNGAQVFLSLEQLIFFFICVYLEMSLEIQSSCSCMGRKLRERKRINKELFTRLELTSFSSSLWLLLGLL